MKGKIAIAAVGAALLVCTASTDAQAPSDPQETVRNLRFTPIQIETMDLRPIIDHEETPEPTRPVVEVKQPKPNPSVRPYKAPTSPVIKSSVSGATKAKRYALSVLGARQFSCIDAIWSRESRWRYWAHNRYSGAYGIPQALPGRKMSKFGSDWRTNPITQVKWGINYVNVRYGSACGAWRFWQGNHWY